MAESFSFNKLEEHYASYVKDPQYVYKACIDQVIVILQKLEKTVTNEARKIVCDPENATFRGDTFKVAHIFNIEDSEKEFGLFILIVGVQDM